MSWEVAKTKPRVSESLLTRARSRLDDVEGGNGTWIVWGSKQLNDTADRYVVDGEVDGDLHCSCQDNDYGRYRPVCSHREAVRLYEDEREDDVVGGSVYTDSKTQETATESVSPPRTPPPSLGLLDNPASSRWGSPSLPEWVEEFRSHQEKAVARVERAFEEGARFVFLDAPTGSGKTLIGELVRRRMGTATNYTCSTLTLQSQFLSDYPYSKVVRGRSNYDSPLIDWGSGTCADCRCSPNDHCTNPDLCNHRADPCPDDVCPYRDAKWEARRNPLAVINTAYALAEMNYVGGMKGRGLMIVDECDLLEGALMSFVEVRIPQDLANELGIDPPAKKTVEDAWIKWAPRAYYLVEGGIAKTEATIKSTYDPEIRSKLQRKAERLEGLRDNLARLKDDLGDESRTNWVYSPEEYKGRTTIIFKPVTVDRLAGGVLWNKADRFLLMSASIISPQEMVESLGIPDDEWDVVYVPSTFPVENRQVKVAPVANVVNRNYDVAVPRLVRGIRGVMSLHPNERTLIHTVSYRLAKDLFKDITGTAPRGRTGLWVGKHAGRSVITYTRGSSRDEALNLYKNTKDAVLLAPSLDRGTDLPGELCRCQVIAKVPFPYLGDKQVSARLYGTKNGQAWYSVQTIRTITQMTGRGVRSESDHAVTYILDDQFSKLFRKHGRLFPKWWRDALDWSGETKREVIEAA